MYSHVCHGDMWGEFQSPYSNGKEAESCTHFTWNVSSYHCLVYVNVCMWDLCAFLTHFQLQDFSTPLLRGFLLLGRGDAVVAGQCLAYSLVCHCGMDVFQSPNSLRGGSIDAALSRRISGICQANFRWNSVCIDCTLMTTKQEGASESSTVLVELPSFRNYRIM